MTCHHPHCSKPATRLIGYRKRGGAEVTVGAFCDGHKRAGQAMVTSILSGHSVGFAEPFSRSVEAGKARAR